MDSATNNTLAINKPLGNQIGEEPSETQQRVLEILEKYEYKKSSLISILLEIQEEFNYLPKEAITLVADQLFIREIEVYAVATFYKVFSLKPRGEFVINVCMGTACHVQGAPRILERLERELGIKRGETTSDMKFTLETVRCVGCCGLAPVIMVGDVFYGKQTPSKVARLVDKLAKKAATVPA